MKIADFFVGLGFDIDGAPELKELDAKLSDMRNNAAKLLAVFAGMTAAMGAMLNATLDLARGFNLFEKSTGLSANELKRWQYVAEQVGASGEEVAQSIKTIQQARADIMMGTGNVAPWQLLGIAPGDDPFETLKQLRERIRTLDPAVARSIVGQMGISEGVFAMLRLSNHEFDELQKKFQLTKTNNAILAKANQEWAKFKFEISAVRDRLVAELVPALLPVLRLLGNIVGLLANFTEWLNKGSFAAKVVRIGLIAVAGAIVAITGALVVFVGVLGLATVAMTALDIAAAPLLPVIWAITAVVLVAIGAIAALVLTLQDLWTALQGGESLFVKVFAGIGSSINKVIEDMLRFLGIFDKVSDAMSWLYSKASGGTILSDEELKKLDEVNRKYKEMRAAQAAGLLDPAQNLTNNALAPTAPAQAAPSTVTQANEVNINVQSKGDPYETGRAIADPLRRALSDAAYQIPVPAQ
jgi:hypothetical protein